MNALSVSDEIHCPGSATAFLLTSGSRAALVGASGSVFGLFVVSILSKLSQFNLRRLVCVLDFATTHCIKPTDQDEIECPELIDWLIAM